MGTRLPVYSFTGAQAGEIEVSSALFGGDPNNAVLHQVVVAKLAAARQGTAHTKKRNEVAGSGRKLRRQKGTGRARVGDSRPPHRVGGGRVTGPRMRSYRQRLAKSLKEEGLRFALSARAAAGEIRIVTPFQLTEAKTRALVDALAAMGGGAGALLVLGRRDEVMLRCSRNIPGLQVVEAATVSAYDLLAARQVLITTDALPQLEGRVS